MPRRISQKNLIHRIKQRKADNTGSSGYRSNTCFGCVLAQYQLHHSIASRYPSARHNAEKPQLDQKIDTGYPQLKKVFLALCALIL